MRIVNLLTETTSGVVDAVDAVDADGVGVGDELIEIGRRGDGEVCRARLATRRADIV